MRTKLMDAWGLAKFLAATGWTEGEIDRIYLHLSILGVEDVIDPDNPDEIKTYAKFENADRFRFAHAGNEAEVAEYMMSYRRGCCGYFDELYFVDDVPIMVGFNYGH